MYLSGKKLLQKLGEGVIKTADIVGSTLGPKGKFVLIKHKNGALHPTKDGATVANCLKLEDPVENLGAAALCEAALKTAHTAGDGTTSSIIFAAELFKQCRKLVKNPTEYRTQAIIDGLMKGLELILKQIKKASHPVKTQKILKKIAMTATNNDTELSALVSNLVWKVGNTGVVRIMQSPTNHTTSKVVRGVCLERGLLSAAFSTDPTHNFCEYKAALVLLCNYPLNDPEELFNVLKQVQQKVLIIIAPSYDNAVLSMLSMNKEKGGLQVCPIKAPGYGAHQQEILTDLSKLTGALVFDKTYSVSLSTFNETHLGKVNSVIIDTVKSLFTLSDDIVKQNKDIIKQRSKEVEKELKKAKNDTDKQQLNNRLAILNGKVGELYVGANTEMELREKLDRIDDACRTTQDALKHGYLLGAGESLYEVATKLENSRAQIHSDLYRFWESPGIISQCKQILYKVLKIHKERFNKQEVSYKSGIYDSTHATTEALSNAVSVICQLLNTTTAIIEE